MTNKKYVVIPFEDADEALRFQKAQEVGFGRFPRILDSDEYPTKRYNGWTNYETWAVALWIDNEQGSHSYWREAAQETWDVAEPGDYDWQTREQQAAYVLAERIKDEYEEASQERTGEASVFADLLNAALSEVNWEDIVEHMIADVDKAESTEESEDANV